MSFASDVHGDSTSKPTVQVTHIPGHNPHRIGIDDKIQEKLIVSSVEKRALDS
jgi:hypothetical protein